MADQRLYETDINREVSFQQQRERTIINSAINIKSYFGNYFEATSVIKEIKNKDNLINMMSGPFGGAKLVKENTIIVGLCGAVFNNLVTIDTGARVVFQNITFRQSKDTFAGLVQINEGARVQFINCFFERFDRTNEPLVGATTATGGSYINLNTSVVGPAVDTMFNCVGCLFDEGAASGAAALVENIGATTQGRGNIVFSINSTSLPAGAAAVLTTGLIT